MTRNKKIFIIIISIIVILFVLVLIRGPEDTWICKDGQWVKHGVPYASMPEGECDLLDNFNFFR